MKSLLPTLTLMASGQTGLVQEGSEYLPRSDAWEKILRCKYD
jgi:hypothetical protein